MPLCSLEEKRVVQMLATDIWLATDMGSIRECLSWFRLKYPGVDFSQSLKLTRHDTPLSVNSILIEKLFELESIESEVDDKVISLIDILIEFNFDFTSFYTISKKSESDETKVLGDYLRSRSIIQLEQPVSRFVEYEVARGNRENILKLRRCFEELRESNTRKYYYLEFPGCYINDKKLEQNQDVCHFYLDFSYKQTKDLVSLIIEDILGKLEEGYFGYTFSSLSKLVDQSISCADILTGSLESKLSWLEETVDSLGLLARQRSLVMICGVTQRVIRENIEFLEKNKRRLKISQADFKKLISLLNDIYEIICLPKQERKKTYAQPVIFSNSQVENISDDNDLNIQRVSDSAQDLHLTDKEKVLIANPLRDTIMDTIIPKLKKYSIFGCSDARRFQMCISSNVNKEDIFKQYESKCVHHEQEAQANAAAAAGEQSGYSYPQINRIHQLVNTSKVGCCTTFAAAAAYDILEMQDDRIHRVEIISSKYGLGSHCYVLLNRAPDSQIDDVNTWGNQTIVVDPWAASMGHGWGVFNLFQYPFPAYLLINLIQNYDSTPGWEHTSYTRNRRDMPLLS